MSCAVPAVEAGTAPVVLRGCLAAQLHGTRVGVARRVVRLYPPNGGGAPSQKTPPALARTVTGGNGCFVLRLTHSPRVAARMVNGRNAFIALVRGQPFTAKGVSGRVWWILSFSRRWSNGRWRPAQAAPVVIRPIVTPLGLTTAAIIRTLS